MLIFEHKCGGKILLSMPVCCLNAFMRKYPTFFCPVVNVNVNLKGKLALYWSWQHYK